MSLNLLNYLIYSKVNIILLPLTVFTKKPWQDFQKKLLLKFIKMLVYSEKIMTKNTIRHWIT